MGTMETSAAFQQALQKVQSVSGLGPEQLLDLYGLYKQSTEGDINIEMPTNIFDIKGKAKYDAWAAHKGMSPADAQQAYVDLVAKLSE